MVVIPHFARTLYLLSTLPLISNARLPLSFFLSFCFFLSLYHYIIVNSVFGYTTLLECTSMLMRRAGGVRQEASKNPRRGKVEREERGGEYADKSTSHASNALLLSFSILNTTTQPSLHILIFNVPPLPFPSCSFAY